MATRRAALPPLPLAACNFRVRIEGVRAELGFCAVEFPPLPAAGKAAQRQPGDGCAELRLTRAFDGSAELQRWWSQHAQAAAGRQPRGRLVEVTLLDAPGGMPALVWRFGGCRPLWLAHGRLDAQAPALLHETLALAFDSASVEVPARR